MPRMPASLDNIAFAALILIAFAAIAPRAGHALLSHSVPVLEEGPQPAYALEVSAGRTPLGVGAGGPGEAGESPDAV